MDRILISAIKDNSIERVRDAITNGANVKCREKPLKLAFENYTHNSKTQEDSIQIIKLLLNAGASIEQIPCDNSLKRCSIGSFLEDVKNDTLGKPNSKHQQFQNNIISSLQGQ